jgi:hypothetical protein
MRTKKAQAESAKPEFHCVSVEYLRTVDSTECCVLLEVDKKTVDTD